MKNMYEVRGQEIVLFIDRKDGNVVETIVDKMDLERLMQSNHRWHASISPGMRSFYINTNIKIDGKHATLSLHRFLTNAPFDKVVDHIDGNTLNNRRSNLRICEQSENSQNRNLLRIDNTSGYRGVSWKKEKQKWEAYLSLNHKRKLIGYFDDLDEAARAVSSARKKSMPFSREA